MPATPTPTCPPCVGVDDDGDLFFGNYPAGHPKFDPDDADPCVPSVQANTCDFDNDGLINGSDNDDDGDGVADLYDIQNYNPDSDSDGDGLTDIIETGGGRSVQPWNGH